MIENDVSLHVRSLLNDHNVLCCAWKCTCSRASYVWQFERHETYVLVQRLCTRYLLCFSGDAYGTPSWAFPRLAHDGAEAERSVRGLCAPLVADALPGIASVGFEAVAAALYPGGRPRDTGDIAAFAAYFDGYTRGEWEVLHRQPRVMTYIESVIADALTIDYLATLYA